MPTPVKLFQLSVLRPNHRYGPRVQVLVLCLICTVFVSGCPQSRGEVNTALSASSAADEAARGMPLAVVAATATSTSTPVPPTPIAPTVTTAPPTLTPTVTPVPPTPMPRFIPAPTATATVVPAMEPIAEPAPVEAKSESVTAASASGGEFANSERGVLSYMCDCLHGNNTASGEVYNKDAFVAAHKSLPFGTQVRVTNLTNGLTTNVTIVDRLPHNNPHMIDVSSIAARQLNLISAGNADALIEWN